MIHQYITFQCDECDYEDTVRLNVTSLLSEKELKAMQQYLLLYHKKREH